MGAVSYEQPVTADPTADAALLERVGEELTAVERALDRLDDGTYGRCAVCGAELAPAELDADPLAARCAAHG